MEQKYRTLCCCLHSHSLHSKNDYNLYVTLRDIWTPSHWFFHGSITISWLILGNIKSLDFYQNKFPSIKSILKTMLFKSHRVKCNKRTARTISRNVFIHEIFLTRFFEDWRFFVETRRSQRNCVHDEKTQWLSERLARNYVRYSRENNFLSVIELANSNTIVSRVFTFYVNDSNNRVYTSDRISLRNVYTTR